MAEPSAWTPDPAWAGIVSAGRTGRTAHPPGLAVAPLEGYAIATVTAGRAGQANVTAAAARLGVELPGTPRLVRGPDLAALWSGPGQWLVLSPAPGLAERLAGAFGRHAAVADQTGSRAILRLTGPRLRDVLARGCMVDLHPGAFAVGDVALTAIAHIGVQIWRPDADAIEIAVSRSYAGSLWSWLGGAAAADGCEVVAG